MILGQNALSQPALSLLQKQYPGTQVSCEPCTTDRWFFDASNPSVAAPPAGITP